MRISPLPPHHWKAGLVPHTVCSHLPSQELRGEQLAEENSWAVSEAKKPFSHLLKNSRDTPRGNYEMHELQSPFSPVVSETGSLALYIFHINISSECGLWEQSWRWQHSAAEKQSWGEKWGKVKQDIPENPAGALWHYCIRKMPKMSYGTN